MPPSSASAEQDGAKAAESMAFSTSPQDPDKAGVAPDGTADQSDAIGPLLEQLRDDRQWLLRQLDAGSWPAFRLDLAALERELGQLLDQASERLGP